MVNWTKARYPGDAVRVRLFTAGSSVVGIAEGTVGFVQIQDYGDNLCVGSYLPGTQTCIPGDTPKTEPEHCEWVATHEEADKVYERYVRKAHAQGWMNYG